MRKPKAKVVSGNYMDKIPEIGRASCRERV